MQGNEFENLPLMIITEGTKKTSYNLGLDATRARSWGIQRKGRGEEIEEYLQLKIFQ
ncbi:MAG: hypothetical protein WA130_02860 [Candidatus Methanoperedens sp.]